MKQKIICITMAAFIGILSLLACFGEKEIYSVWERRPLNKFPQLSAETIFDGAFMENFESYATDNFPLRNSFRRIRALWDNYVFLKSDTNDLYIKNGYVSKMEYPLKKESLDNALSHFEKICEKYLLDNNIYFSIIPDKNYFTAGAQHLSVNYDEMTDCLKGGFKSAEYIDIFGLLQLEDYYRTDTHWRQEKLIKVAEKLCTEMGAEFTDNFTENTLESDFYGVYYGQSALPMAPDNIKYLTSDIINSCTVYDYEHSKQTEIYDMEKAEGNDPYEIYLSGPISLLEINNPKAQNDRHLIIFRDSFGSSVAPLMAEGYSKITLVDIRYISSNYVGSFVDFDNADVLFLYSTLVLNNSETFK